MRTQDRELLYLDAGDLLFPVLAPAGSPQVDLARERARVLARALARMGVAAVNVGRQDLGAGLGLLETLGKETGIPWVSANLRRAGGGHPFPRWRVISWGPARIAVFGLLRPDPSRDAALGIEVDPPAHAAAAVLRELPAVDGVICLSNLGLPLELELARGLPGLTAIVGGGSAELLGQPQMAGTSLVLHVGDKGKFVGVLDLSRKGLKAASSGYAHRVVTLDASVGEDPEIASWVKGYKDLQTGSRKPAPAPAPLPGPGSQPAKPPSTPSHFAGSLSCRECHPDAYRAWLETRHSRAYLALRGREQEPGCAECHASTLQGPTGRLIEFSVACETCHGAAGGHRGAAGVVRKPGETLCRRCHRGFHRAEAFDERAAYERIRCDRR